MKIQKHLKRLKELEEKNKEMQKAMNDFCKVFAPSSYAPILEINLSDVYLEQFDEEVRDWLEYYLYEASIMKGSAEVTVEGKVYDFKNEDDVVKFFKENF